MFTYPTNQFPYKDESASNASTANTCGDTSLYGSLRMALAMATLKKRRGVWYARVQWYKNGQQIQTEKQVPLRTDSKVTARERLAEVKKVEGDIKAGIGFSFPWLCNDTTTSVKRFTVSDAVDVWIGSRKSNGIRKSTIKRNRYSMESFMSSAGNKRPLTNVTTKVIDAYRNTCIDNGMKPDGININLRTIKTFLRWCDKRDYIHKMSHIDMVSKSKTMPLYIPDRIFADLLRLDWLENKYKTAFLFYRETGCRASEPFVGELDGNWLLISGDKTKQRAEKELHLNSDCLRLCVQMRNHLEKFNGTVESLTQNLSKTFLKAMRKIDGEDTKYHLHCLRHTFAVRRYLQTRDIYLVKQEMGHASVKTTDVYAQFSLRRLEMDFPTLVENPESGENSEKGHGSEGHTPTSTVSKSMVF